MIQGLFTYLTMDEPELGPWCAGNAECLDCGRYWTAVWPIGAASLECPSCHGDNTDRDAATGA